jgi:hypothetical protein
MFIVRHNRVATAKHWGLVLAAGDGTRLQNYVQQFIGDRLPNSMSTSSDGVP